jgi:hypothetical protein
VGTLILMAAVPGLFVACGIPLQSSPEPLPRPEASILASAGPVNETPIPQATPTQAGINLWFVRAGELAATPSDLPSGSTVSDILRALFDGAESHGGSASDRSLVKDPNTGEPLLTAGVAVEGATNQADVAPGTSIANVALSEAFFAQPAVDQSLLLGQVVMSVTGGGYRSVVFTDALGGTLAVPLPNGRLLTGPVLRSDFDSLILTD